MTFSRPFAGAALAAVVLMGAGCSLGGSQQGAPTGGIWYSPDRGSSWQQLQVLYTSNGVGTWSNADVVVNVLDPNDGNAMYAGTRENGMFYTYDSGKTWMQPKDMATGPVQAIAVSPADKCDVVAAKFAEVWMSRDCNRSYKRIFTPELVGGDFIKTLLVDRSNASVFFAVSQNGRFFKSTTSGANWTSPMNFDTKVVQLVQDPADGRVLFTATAAQGLYKSVDGGETWASLAENLKNVEGSMNINAIASSKSQSGTYIAATTNGLMRTTDGGMTWGAIKLLTSPTNVLSVSIDPKNANFIYYGTDKVFYRSANGGANWETIKLPTARAAGTLLVHPDMNAAIFMGAKNIPTK